MFAEAKYRGFHSEPVRLRFNSGNGRFEGQVDSGCLGISRIFLEQAGQSQKVLFTNIVFEDRFHFPIITCGTARPANKTVRVDAFKLDHDGEIVFATDHGNQGIQSYANSVGVLYGKLHQVLPIVFPCRAVTVLDIMDPRYLKTLDVARVLSESDSEPQRYGTVILPNRSRSGGWQPLAMTAFVDPGAQLKLLMSTDSYGLKFLLINAPDRYISDEYLETSIPADIEQAAFPGYGSEERIVHFPAYKVARDIWVLNDGRMRSLRRFGIRNQRLEGLHQSAYESLVQAKRFRQEKKWAQHVKLSHKAWGLETKAYPDVLGTAIDTVKAVIFYFALLIPFSFFMERLLFGFPDFRKQLAGFCAIFFCAFLVLRFVHPAFKISSSPYVIFLGFILLSLGLLVSITVALRCAGAIRAMKAEASGIQETDIGRLAATSSAVMLGISNLRKRRVRTTLTLSTLIMLTFAVLSFSSVNTSIQFWQIPAWDFCPYQGALIRSRNYEELQDSAVQEIESVFAGTARVTPRGWKIFDIEYPELGFWEIRNTENGNTTHANAILGLTPEEVNIPKGVVARGRRVGFIKEAILPGTRWFAPDEADSQSIVLSAFQAKKLGLSVERVASGSATVQLFQEEFRVVGVFDEEKMDRLRNLDGEQITPVDMSAIGEEFLQELQRVDPTGRGGESVEVLPHLSSRTVAILPYGTLKRYGVGARMLAIDNFSPGSSPREEIKNLLRRVSMLLFFGDGEQVSAYSSVGTTTFSSLGSLFIPILIAAAIVFNTMLGAVYERTREIGIFCSVGLAPKHIGALFLAESLVFATIAAVIGYLLSQCVAFFLSAADLLGGINLNYSSMSAVMATLIVMATVLLSTLYPANKASQMAVPDVRRKWNMALPKGDSWKFIFPFTINVADVAALNFFLFEYFRASDDSSVGRFFTRDASVEAMNECKDAGSGYRLRFDVWLAPYDMSISQRVTLESVPTSHPKVYEVRVVLDRLSGEVSSWIRMNRDFLNVLRKRFLVWQTLPKEAKRRFRREGNISIVQERV